MGLLKKCNKCNKKGLFLKIIDGLCSECIPIRDKEIEQYLIDEQIKANQELKLKEEIELKEKENLLLQKKDKLYLDIQNNIYDIDNVIKEYKNILNELLNFKSFKENNIEILIKEIEEKEEYIIMINQLQTCIRRLNDPKCFSTSMLLDFVDEIDNKHLPKLRECEERNIEITNLSSCDIEEFIKEKSISIQRKIKSEEKKLKDKSNYVVFDLETTGLYPSSHEITEIGAVKVIDGKVVDTFNMLVKPTKKISKKITELTGITNEMVQNELPIEDILPKFIDFIEKLPLVAHNAKFDYGFINENYKAIYGKEFRRKKSCTMELYRKWHKDKWGDKAPSAKLGSAIHEVLGYEEYNNYTTNAHRGLNDAEFTQKLYESIV